MPASDFKPGTADLSSVPSALPALTSDHHSITHRNDEIDPEALERLREFFVLLDQWDQEQQA